jgi:hypothetical protein
MGAFNELLLERSVDGSIVDIQFKYGLRWQLQYRIGDKIDWGKLRRPKTADQKIRISGIGEDASGRARYFAIEIDNDIIRGAWEVSEEEWTRLDDATYEMQSEAEAHRSSASDQV